MVKSNLKVVEQPDKMSFRQVEQFAHNLAELLMNADEELARALLVIFEEIGRHSFDQAHVESITIQMRDYIFMLCISESDEAKRRVIEATRRKWVSHE
jgi:hypothetical protein